MKLKIITVNNYFGQGLPTEFSLDLYKLQSYLNSYSHDVDFIDIQYLQYTAVEKDTLYITGSHQNRDIKKYIDDCVSVIFSSDNSELLIPSPKNLLAHDNKGVQALIAQRIGAEFFPKQNYFYRCEKINQPKVIKAPAGAGSSGVELVRTSKQLERCINKFVRYEYNIKDISFLVKNFLKKMIFKSKYSKKFTEYHKKYGLYCLQDFYDGLQNDFKVLVFGDTSYVLERKVRKGSFKASGSGKFSYPEIDVGLLNFSHKLREKLDTPYVSLDVVKLQDGSYKCIEFQCVHFGPYTQLNAKHKYVKTPEGAWVKEVNDLTLEGVYAQAINEFIQNAKKYRI